MTIEQPIPSTPLLRRAAAVQAAARRADWRPFAFPAALIALWWLATTLHWVDTRILVSPWATLGTAWHLVTGGMLWDGLGHSLLRDISGFALGSAAGLLLGSLLGSSRLADGAVGPTFHAYKQVALFAWIPLISVWFGMKEPAKIAFIALATLPPVLQGAYEGIRAVSREHVEVGRVFALSRWQLYRLVILPSAAPQILTGLRLGLIYAWLGTIGAEYFFAAGPGVGNILIDGREHFQMDVVIVGVAAIGAVGYAFHWLAGIAEARLLRWRRPRA
jgi:sulfonate transport system permease protein